MRRLIIVIILAGAVAGCARSSVIPDFAAKPYAPFNRADAVAIALREWRLFGSLTDALPEAAQKPERAPGLWERVGEYWWLGLAGTGREARWTGKHDETGRMFPASDDERYAWSAAFISYVMRIAGAGDRFPYASSHAAYVNAAASGRSPILRAHAAQSYAPKPGDLLCFGRDWAARLSFSDLPTPYAYWPGHCAIVVTRQAASLDVVGGNDADAVTMDHVTIGSDGSLDSGDGQDWPIAVEVRYDVETDPDPGAGS